MMTSNILQGINQYNLGGRKPIPDYTERGIGSRNKQDWCYNDFVYWPNSTGILAHGIHRNVSFRRCQGIGECDTYALLLNGKMIDIGSRKTTK